MLRRFATIVLILAAGWLPVAVTTPPGAPFGVIVAFGEDPRTSATITWLTSGPAEAVVAHGPDLEHAATGVSRLAPGGGSTRVHEVALWDLPPGSQVRYRVEGGDERAFRLAPVEPRAFRFAVFGDHGIDPESRVTAAMLAQAQPDFAILAGDVSYADGTPTKWDEWARVVEPLASFAPLVVAPGNHEDEPGLGTAAFRARLAQPGAELYFGFDYGRVHFTVVHSTLSSAAKEGVLPDMLAFLAQDLADASARRAAGELDFLVVVQHHPLYGNAAGNADRRLNAPLVALEEPLLLRHGVDLLLTAHNHHYERSHPMAGGLPVPGGYVQIITGGGGKSLYEFVDPNDFAPWSAAYARRYHMVEIEASDALLQGRAISTDDVPGELLDVWSIARRT